MTLIFDQFGNQRSSIFPDNLIKSFGPTQTLCPGLTEGCWLFIVQNCLAAITDTFSLDCVDNRKFDILGQQVELPAAVFLNNLAAEQEACSRNRTVCSQHHAGIVEVLCFSQKPQGVTSSNPVGAEVFGVAVTGDNLISLTEHYVHLVDVVGVKQIIRIKNQISIMVICAIILRNVAERKIQSIAFSNLLLIKALIHHCTQLPCNLCCVQLSATTKISISFDG